MTKGASAILLAFPVKQHAKNWANLLVEAVPSIKTAGDFNKKKISETFLTGKKKSRLDFEIVISRCNIGLYDELYCKFLTVRIDNLDSKIVAGETTKVKLSFCSLMALNCDKAFQGKDLSTVLFIGPTQAPKKKEASQFLMEDTLNDTRSMMSSSAFPESKRGSVRSRKSRRESHRSQSSRRKSHRSNLDDSVLSHLKFHEYEKLAIENQFKKPKIPEIDGVYDSRVLTELDESDINPNDLTVLTNAQTEVDEYRVKFDKKTVLKTISGVKAQEKGALVYVEQNSKTQSIRVKAVNIKLFFDAEYVNKLLDLVSKFTPGKPKKRDPFANYKYDWKYLPKPKVDELVQKLSLNFNRVCLVCRTKSRNLTDVILLKTRIQVRTYTTKMINNIFIKRFACRDLTNHPLTKRVHELQDYENQPKNVLFSFKEGSDKMDELSDEKQMRLNKNGITVLVEVTKQPYRDRHENNIGTRAEVFLNNGEANLFIQPTFRLLDFLFYSVLPFTAPDDTKHAPRKEIERRLAEPSQNRYNVFISNFKMNMRPNFAVDKFPVLHAKEVVIVNAVAADQSRHLGGSKKPLWSEVITIDIIEPYIQSFDKKHKFMTFRDLKVKFSKLVLKGYYERLLGKIPLFQQIDVNNKIDVLIQGLRWNMRRDDFYSFIAYTFGNLSWNDEMDDMLLIKPFDKEGPFMGMDVRVLIDDMLVSMLDDRMHVFMDLGFEQFFVSVAKDTEKNQTIQLFGKGLDSNCYSYKVTHHGSTKKMRFPLIKIMKNIEDVVNYDETEIEKVFIPGSQFNDEQTLDERDIDLILNDAESRYNEDSEFPLEFTMKVAMTNKAHKTININLANIGLSVIIPIIFAGQKMTKMTWEMAMNYLIRPTLTKYFGNQRTYINISDVFLFLLPNNGIDFNMIAHIPELYVVHCKLWEDTEVVKNQILMHFDKSEFEDHQYQALDPQPLKKSNIYHLAVELLNTTLYLVDDDDISGFCHKLIENKMENFLYDDINARMIMSPIGQIGYHLQTNTLADKFKEIYFSRGVARVGQVLMKMTTYDIHYLTRWAEYMDKKYWKNIKIGDGYEDYIKGVMNNLLPADWLKHIQRTYKSKLDILFAGMRVVLLDDVYDTNIELLKLYIHPITTTQIKGYKINGFSDIYTQIEAEYYNYNCKEWEPILENFNFTLRQSNSDEYGAVTEIYLSDENACINFSMEFLCILQGIQKQRDLRFSYFQAKEVIETFKREMIREERRKLRKYQQKESQYGGSNRESMFRSSVANGNDFNQYMSKISDSNFSRSFMHQKSYGPIGQSHGRSIIDQGELNLEKNPLQFNFMSKKGDRLAKEDFNETDRAIYINRAAHALRNILNGNPFNNEASMISNPHFNNGQMLPFTSQRQSQGPVQTYPTKEKIHQLIEKSKFKFNDEINLKECPFFVKNMIGYDLIFHLNYNEISDSFFIPNRKTVGLPYPYNIHKELSGVNTGYKPMFSYYIYILNRSNMSMNLIISDTRIISQEPFKIDVQSQTQDYSYASPIYVCNTPNIMRELVTLRSQFVLRNEIKPNLTVDIDNGYFQMKIKENQEKPIPFNATDYPLTIFAELLLKNHKSKTKFHDYDGDDFMNTTQNRYDDLDMRDMAYKQVDEDGKERHYIQQQGKGFSLHDVAKKEGNITNYRITDHFAFNIFVEDDEHNPESKNLVFVPPLIIKNRVLSDINFYVVKQNFDRNYDERHSIRFDEEDFEIYDTLGERITIKIGIRRLKSGPIEIDLTDRDRVIKQNVWLFREKSKKVQLNVIGRFERGSYVIDVFMKAILVDELFMNLNLSQNVGVTEEVLQPINKEVYEEGRNFEDDDPYEEDDQLLTEEDRFKEGLKEAKKFSSNLKLSNVYFLQLDEDLHLSDPKYVYESTTIGTDKIGNKDYRIFYFNNDNKCAEYYDIVACTYNHTFGKP